MADGANTRDGIIHSQLVTACVSIDIIAADEMPFTVERHTVWGDEAQLVLMRPDGVGVVAVALTLPGIEHKHLLHETVAVPVVLRPVNLTGHQVAGFDHHFPRCRINVVTAGSTIILIILRHTDRPDHVEVQLKLSVALVMEVVADATFEAAFAESPLVSHAAEEWLVVTVGKEFVLELSQDDKSFPQASISSRRLAARPADRPSETVVASC